MKLPLAFASLASSRRWAAWRDEPDDNGRMQKVPRRAPDCPARVNVPAMWLRLERAADLVAVFAEQRARAGLALLLGDPGDGRRVLALDLDAAALDEAHLKPWARDVLDVFAGHYSEVSPSGSGVHVLALVDDDAMRAFDTARKAALPAHVKARRKFRRGAPADGAKAEAIEVMPRGFITVTGKALPDAASTIHDVTADQMRALARVIAVFLGVNGPAPAAAEVTIAGSAEQPTARQPKPKGAGVRVSASRLARMACELDDAPFQLLCLLWLHARPGDIGTWLSSVSLVEMCMMPGARVASRRTPDALRAAGAALAEKGVARIVRPHSPPADGKAGVVALREVFAPFARDPQTKSRLRLVRTPRAIWQRMVFSLPPRRLRVLAWIIGTFHDAVDFMLPLRMVGEALGMKPERVAEEVAGLAADGWLDVLELPDAFARRPGRYRLKALEGEEPPPPPPTPGMDTGA